MQNKEEEEKRIREDFKNQFKNKILRISNHTPEAFDLIDDLKDFISQEIEKAREEERKKFRESLNSFTYEPQNKNDKGNNVLKTLQAIFNEKTYG